jgi:assimilatory nitrate reductase catalytic subunit
VAVEGGTLKGDTAHPANFGRLCSKGAALRETLDLPDRLTRPIYQGNASDWDSVLDLIAKQFTRIIDEHGPDAIGFYVSGQFLTEDYYVANKLMKGFIGAANIDTNSRLCMSSSVAGHVRAFGEDVVPGCYEDLEEADLVVQVGSNMAWCHPVLHQRLMTARERRGTRVVTIDPRRTATAETADLHLALAQGTDVWLFNGLLVHLADSGALDRGWIERHVSGFEETLRAARHSAPSLGAVAAATDIGTGDLHAFYDLFTRTERVVTLYSQGVNQSVSGTDKVNAVINCHLATGRIGRAGMGPFSLTGQPNAMGGREVGGLANQLAAHMDFKPENVACVRRFWNAPNLAERPGLKAVDLFDAAAEGRVKALWIAATNPAASMPRAGRVREALEQCPLVIVADAWPTDTTALADIILPAASWSEKDGTVTNSERRISRQRAFQAAPGEARPDWWMFAEVARRMGWGDAFDYAAPADVFREHAALSAFENHGARLFDLGALASLDNAGYDALRPVQWPCPAADMGRGQARLFSRGGFPRPDGRAQMVPILPRPQEDAPRDPLTLNTGRLRDQWHTMTRTGRVARLMQHAAAPVVTLHPRDAAARGIVHDGLVAIESAHGSTILRAAVDSVVRLGEIFVPMHWTNQFSSSGPIGRLVHALTDPISGQPDLKGTKVRLTALGESWRGLLFHRRDGVLVEDPGVHWSRRPINGGFEFALSGTMPLDALLPSETALRTLLTLSPSAEIVSYSDPKNAVFRHAGIVEGVLESCVFFDQPHAVFPQANEARALLGTALSPEARLSLLAGFKGVEKPTETMICSCFGVDENTLRECIHSRGLHDVSGIGRALRAGTNCGSCLPELQRLLASASRPAVVA